MLGRRDAITVTAHGNLAVPPGAVGLVLFIHGSRNRDVAQTLRARGLATLHLEPRNDDLDELADRIEQVTDWVMRESNLAHVPIAYFASGTAVAAALVAATRRPDVRAVVSRCGRPDLAGAALPAVHAPTLFAVPGAETELLDLNRDAIARMTVPTQLAIIPGASFEEPGALDELAALSAEWILGHFATAFADPDPARAFGRQFRDRRAAGARLATMLEHHAGPDTIVFGLPRGGLVVADAVAYALNAPLDVWLATKIGMPIQPELGMGALAEGAALVLDPALVRWSGAPPHELLELVHRKGAELRRRARHYRRDHAPLPLHGKTAILVDEGIATPTVLRAAIRGARKRGAKAVVVAAPVASADAVAALRLEADEVVCVALPQHLNAVGAWYESFRVVGEHEVIDLLAQREPERQAG